jgi:hypothetical protein
MIVQTIDRAFDAYTYHAFLLAGASINPAAPSIEEIWADDFLRFSEPPAHDRWIPGTGRRQASQANLTAHYQAPWVPHLHGIEKGIVEALHSLFGAPPPRADQPPESLLRHLKFLRSEAGAGGVGGAPRKPEVDLTHWRVEDGRWDVRFTVRAKNRSQGWDMRPTLAFVGLDGKRDLIAWDSLIVEEGPGIVADGSLRIEATTRGRFNKVLLRGVSSRDLPIPAEEAGVEVVLQKTGPLTTPAGKDES